MMARVHVLLALSIWMVSADPVVYIQGAIEITFPGSVTIQDLQTSTYQTVLASALMNLTGAPAGSVTIGIVPGPQTTTTTTIASTAGPSATTVGPSGTAGPNMLTTGPTTTKTTDPNATTGPTTTGPSTTTDPNMITTGPTTTKTTDPNATTGPTTTGPSTTTDPNMITTTKTTTTQAAGRRLAVHVSLKYSIKTTQSKAAAIQTQLLKAKTQFDSRLQGAAYKDPTIAKALDWLVVHNVQTPVQSATTVTTTTRTYTKAAMGTSKMGTSKMGTSKMGTSKMGTNITNGNMSLNADGAQPAAVLSGIIGLMLSANYFH